jgi:hypothetical protein
MLSSLFAVWYMCVCYIKQGKSLRGFAVVLHESQSRRSENFTAQYTRSNNGYLYSYGIWL